MKTITQKRLQSLLHYDPETGHFTHIVNRTHKKAGEIAGAINQNGYVVITLDGRHYYAHRLAFLYMTGSFPENQVDHINRVRSENSWYNLRAVTSAENNRNASIRKDNKSGYAGVSQARYSKRWVGAVSIGGKRKQLGTFDTKEEAAKAVADAKFLHYGIVVSPHTTITRKVD